MDVVRGDLEHVSEELPGSLAICFVRQLRDCKLTGPVNAYKETKFAFFLLYFSDADMERSR